MKVTIGFEKDDWYTQAEGDNRVYVFTTKRSAFRKAEEILTEAFTETIPQEGREEE